MDMDWHMTRLEKSEASIFSFAMETPQCTVTHRPSPPWYADSSVYVEATNSQGEGKLCAFVASHAYMYIYLSIGFCAIFVLYSATYLSMADNFVRLIRMTNFQEPHNQ